MRPSTTEGRPALGRTEIGIRAALRQVAEVLAHLGRAGGAVEPDHVGAQGVEGGQGGADLGAHEHAAGGLDGHLDLDRHLSRPAVGHGPPAADDGRLGLQEILDGLDDEQVDAAVEQPGGRLLVAVALLDEGDLAERGDLGARPERAGHPAAVGRPGRRPPGRCGPTWRPARGSGAARPYSASTQGRQPKLSVSTTSQPTSKKRPVQVGDHVGPGVDQDLVAALEGGAAEIVGPEVAQLQVGAGGAVEDDHPLPHRVEVGTHRHRLPGAGGPLPTMFPASGPDGMSGGPRSGAPFGPYFGSVVVRLPSLRRHRRRGGGSCCCSGSSRSPEPDRR